MVRFHPISQQIRLKILTLSILYGISNNVLRSDRLVDRFCWLKMFIFLLGAVMHFMKLLHSAIYSKFDKVGLWTLLFRLAPVGASELEMLEAGAITVFALWRFELKFSIGDWVIPGSNIVRGLDRPLVHPLPHNLTSWYLGFWVNMINVKWECTQKLIQKDPIPRSHQSSSYQF